MGEVKPITQQPTPSATLTPEQQAIAARVASESADDGWLHITEDEMNDFSLSVNPWTLPREARKLQDEKVYAFRFCERKPDRIDMLCRSTAPPLKWGIVNAVQLPELAHLVDPITGGVCVGGQILLFKPWAHHMRVKEAKTRLQKGEAARGLDGAAVKLSTPDGRITATSGESQKLGSRDVVVQAEDPTDIGPGDKGVEDLVAP